MVTCPFFFLFKFEFSPIYIFSLIVVLIRVSLSFYSIYIEGTYRTTDCFNKLSNIRFVVIAFNVLLSPLIYYFNFNGYLMMQLGLAIINILLLHIYRPLRVKPKFQKDIFLFLLKTGLPLFITSYAISFIDTIPRLFILHYGNETLLGLYAPVLMITSAFALLPNTLATYYYPKLSFNFGKFKNPAGLLRSLNKIYLVSFLFLHAFYCFCLFCNG